MSSIIADNGLTAQENTTRNAAHRDADGVRLLRCDDGMDAVFHGRYFRFMAGISSVFLFRASAIFPSVPLDLRPRDVGSQVFCALYDFFSGKSGAEATLVSDAAGIARMQGSIFSCG